MQSGNNMHGWCMLEEILSPPFFFFPFDGQAPVKWEDVHVPKIYALSFSVPSIPLYFLNRNFFAFSLFILGQTQVKCKPIWLGLLYIRTLEYRERRRNPNPNPFIVWALTKL
jgi:hypothetical protein